MQRLAIFIAILCLVAAAGLSWVAATLSTRYIEEAAAHDVQATLQAGGFDWADVAVDGLSVRISGPAPREGARFAALTAAREIVAAGRVIDDIRVVDPDDLAAPRFSLELLRNGDGVSLIGLVPGDSGRDAVLNAVGDAGGGEVTDMLETAEHPAPEHWQASVDYALESLKSLPRSKISVVPGTVTITAIADSQAEKVRLETLLQSARPQDVELILQISAPRPVVTPFSLRLVSDSLGVRFDSCTADTTASRDRILAAATGIGLTGKATCMIGLGTPSPRWGEAAALAIRAIGDLGGGTLTFSDADITLVAPDTVTQTDFDRIMHGLETALPDVFSLHAVLTPKPLVEGGTPADIPEFLVTLSPEGLIQLRGRHGTDRAKLSVANFARAEFGSDNVHDTTRVDSSMPDGWGIRVLIGLEALSKLHHGTLVVTPVMIELKGVTALPEAQTEVTQILSERLGEASRYQINVTYDETLNRVELPPTPQECVDRINRILDERQITFEPGSIKVEGEAMDVVKRIAEAMDGCDEVAMEIGGHTDSQGREPMNLTLSQARAEAVMDALLGLEVLTKRLTARGYGETRPIADNETEEGRQRNRRIEFRLIGPDGRPLGEDAIQEEAGEGGPADQETVDGEDADMPLEEEDGAMMEAHDGEEEGDTTDVQD
jgi:OOP family OmpA-OmpF porin